MKPCKKCERISAGKRDCELAEWTGRWDIYEPVGFVLATLVAPQRQLSCRANSARKVSSLLLYLESADREFKITES